MSNDPYRQLISRLSSQDANDRVKAAAELGEVGKPEHAPKLLEACWNDEASTVRQIAVQAYGEILKDQGADEIFKVASEHTDEYTRLYAISSLGSMSAETVENYLNQLLTDSNPKIRLTVIRSMIHAQTDGLGNQLLELYETEDDAMVLRNIIEALLLWKSKSIVPKLKTREDLNHLLENEEFRTFYNLALAIGGDKQAVTFLEEGEIDTLTRIKIRGKWYRGRNGLLEAIDLLK